MLKEQSYIEKIVDEASKIPTEYQELVLSVMRGRFLQGN